MGTQIVQLKEVTKLEIVSLMDNSADFLSSSTKKEAESFHYWNQTHSEMPFAEHGFSLLIRVFSNEVKSTILFDTGVSPNGVVINANRMGIDLREVSLVVLSHGHYDHLGGLASVVKAVNKKDLQIISHEDMFNRRGTVNSKGEIKEYPAISSFDTTSVKIINTKEPQLFISNLACVTGEIPRNTDFEKGLINNRIYKNNSWQPDPLILDERALIFNVKDKGLVVISGCAHSGIINTVHYAQQIVGSSKVYAIIGGFHLAGKTFEKRIKATVEELKRINPELIIASHCTGWRAIFAIKEALPGAFIFNSVGNRYNLEG